MLRAPIHLHPKEAYSFTGFVKTEKKELSPSMMNFLTSPWHRHTEALVFVKAFPLKLKCPIGYPFSSFLTLVFYSISNSVFDLKAETGELALLRWIG